MLKAHSASLTPKSIALLCHLNSTAVSSLVSNPASKARQQSPAYWSTQPPAYENQLPAPLLALVGDALIPVALLVVAFDQRYRQRQNRQRQNQRLQRDGATTMAPAEAPQRRRKYRIRGL